MIQSRRTLRLAGAWALFGLIAASTARRASADEVTAASSPDSASTLVGLTGLLDRTRESIGQVTESLRRQNPDVPAELWDNFAARITNPAILTPMYAATFRRHLSSQDLDDLVIFYQTRLGLRLTEATAQIAKATDAAVADWAQSLANDLLKGGTPPSTRQPIPTAPAQSSAPAESIRELLRVSGAARQAQEISRLMIKQLELAGFGEGLIEGARTRLSSGGSLMDLWIPAYQRHFSAAEVEDLIRFYRSPLGTRWVSALPSIQADALAAASDFGNVAAKQSIREILGPLPQWRLMHPLKRDAAPESAPQP